MALKYIMKKLTKNKKTFNIPSDSEKLDKSSKEIQEKRSCIIGYRHGVALLGFLGCLFLNYHRFVIGVSIVAMVNQTNIRTELHNKSTSCPLPENTKSSSEHLVDGEFNWDSSIQGYVLAAGFLGNIFTQVLAGRLSETWGIKQTFLLGNTVSAVFTFISPFASWYHPYALICVQFIRGLSQGFVMPSVYASMGKWFPPTERGFLSTVVVCGYSVGAVFGGAFSGWICDVPQLGWPYTFYICGILSVLLSVLYLIIYYENPSSHPSISKYELNHILKGQETNSSGKAPPLPWRAVFTSIPVYALLFGLFGHYWSLCYFLSVHPTYMGTILHFGMTQNGVVSSVPLFAKTFGGLCSSITSTWLQKKNYVGVDKLRKGCNSIGSFGFCASMFGIYFVGCDTTANVVLFTLSLFFIGLSLSGTMIACIDMSPTFVGTLMGFISSFACLSTFIVPVMVGKLTKDQKIEQWHMVFFISISVVAFSAIVFHVFGSAEVQPWNFVEKQSPQEEDKPSNVSKF